LQPRTNKNGDNLKIVAYKPRNLRWVNQRNLLMRRSRFSAMNDSPIIAFAPGEEPMLAEFDPGAAAIACLNFRADDAMEGSVFAPVANYIHGDLAEFLGRTEV
jgi:hypothetical protein